MFKACDYCRHRKKKCVVPPASARCSDCEHLDLPCDFSARVPSLKRRQTSKRIAARIGAASAAWSEKSGGDGSVSSDNGADEANLKEGDCQLRLAGRRDMANKRLFQPRDSVDGHRDGALSMSQRYWRDVHPFWPFASPEMLEEGESGRDPAFKQCVDVACYLSLNLMKDPEIVSVHSESLMSILQRGRPSMSVIAGTFLLCPFIYYSDELLQKAGYLRVLVQKLRVTDGDDIFRFLIRSNMNLQVPILQYLHQSCQALSLPTSGDASPATPTSRFTYQPRSYRTMPKNNLIRLPSATTTSASRGSPPSSTNAAWQWTLRGSNLILI